MNAAIITARGGSKSIPEKNMHPVAGQPLVSYPIRAAQNASRVDRVCVLTDNSRIGTAAEQLGSLWLAQPPMLAQDDSAHADAIRYAVLSLEAEFPDLENVVVLLGSAAMVETAHVDEALQMLDDDKQLSGVMTVWQAQDDHPLRALADKGTTRNGSRLLTPFTPGRHVGTRRQSYEPAYYYDEGVWAFRKKWVLHDAGPNPWTWMGPACGYIVRPWVAGRDVHSQIDIDVAEWWLASSGAGSRVSGIPKEE